MSALPPPFTESRFEEIEGATKEQIEVRVAPFIEDLHAFLNEESCLHDIQHIRHGVNPQVRGQLAFGNCTPEYEHWYTYNIGGRNEAQFNIGLFPDYLRIGLGFEFTKKAYGKPERVQAAWGRFGVVLRQHRQAFERFAQENSLQVERLPPGKSGRANLAYVRTQRLVRWLLRPKVSDWIFIGRLLRRREDAEILADSVRLKEVMESVFGGFKPLWQETQLQASEYREESS